MNVLVLEAGVDPGAAPRGSGERHSAHRAAENAHAIYHCPGLHAAATEPHLYTQEPAAQTSWGFDVEHYTKPPNPPGSSKYFYPRASALGGCTAHHAMIAVYGADGDWQAIADLTGDESWEPGKMRAIYQRIERARRTVLGGRWARRWERLLRLLDPARDVSAARGDAGWLDVRMSDPNVALRDKRLMRVLYRTVFNAEGLRREKVLWRWIKSFLVGTLVRDLDLNDAETMRYSPEGVALVPLGVNQDGVRRGPREWLLETVGAVAKDRSGFAGQLHIVTGVLARRILFDCGESDRAPRAIGVEFQRGYHLYQASPECGSSPRGDPVIGRYFARREIIVAGGAFNSPQLLMHSGIGDEQDLKRAGVTGITGVNGGSQPPRFVHLPGVGANLLDRCELSVISEMEEPFPSLDGATFNPAAPDDPALQAWQASKPGAAREGIYTTNGAALAILKRSRPDVIQPDLLILGFPIAFRGYYRGWSKELLARRIGDPDKSRKLWSWVILKAYSLNCGSVRLRSADPTATPLINFCYFGDCWNPARPMPLSKEKDDDLAALKHAVRYVRSLNEQAADLMSKGNAASAEIEPGATLRDGSPELEQWILKQTWGHHAAGTCRIGADPWRANPTDLRDKEAVLDSHFRVHGVRGLRVVDASVFPKIPGYFIAVPTYMISEKAADTILNELSV
jgi:choline dehydrogenase-like flavoprotein